MRARKIIFYILMFLPLLAVIVSLQFLPEQIPAHFGADGQADRWGSKYETLIFPIVTVIMGIIMLAVESLSAKQEGGGENNRRISVLFGIVVLVIFNAMTGYFLYVDFTLTENLNDVSADLNSVLFAVLGIALIIFGNFMPKLKKNSWIGIRVPRTLSSETVWRKSHRFGGICFIISGAAVVLTCIFTKGVLCMGISSGIIIAAGIVCLIYVYSVKER
ncbi:MAG: SdpI family protein [Firmicutes bacterium]|nr:SdpI family protein [[Eubacterium] siraeum]MCM1486761.1 SdpI family protein [Bacillota bacterium]